MTSEQITFWPPVKLWSTSVIGEGVNQAVVSDGRVYTMGTSGGSDIISCFSETPGTTNPSPLWTYSYWAPGTGYHSGYPEGAKSTPAIDGNYIYTLSCDGIVNCLDKTNGHPVWSATNYIAHQDQRQTRALEWGTPGSPLIEGNLVIVNGYGHGLAYNKITGSLVWGTNDTQNSGFPSPYAVTIGTQRTVVVMGNYWDPDCPRGNKDVGRILGVDPSNGNVLWWAASEWSEGGGCYADPTICNGTIRFSDGHGGSEGGYDLFSNGPQPNGRLAQKWQAARMASLSTPVLINGYLYGIDYNQYIYPAGVLRCCDPANGTVLWSSTESYGTCSALLAAGGELVVLGMYGSLSVVDATHAGYTVAHSNALVCTDYYNPAITFQSSPMSPAPIIANGVMYVRGNYGSLTAYRVGIRPPVIAIAPRTNQADMVELSWMSDSGTTYDVYKSTNLFAGWPAQPYTNFMGDGSTETFSDPLAMQRSAYYRIKAGQ
jgi:hypothetical protein